MALLGVILFFFKITKCIHVYPYDTHELFSQHLSALLVTPPLTFVLLLAQGQESNKANGALGHKYMI